MRKFIRDLAGSLDRQTKKRPQDRRGQHRHKGTGQHAGLLLQRYLCENATGKEGNPEEKRAILQAAIHAASNPEVRALYAAAFERWDDALPELTTRNEVRTQGRLIVGLGTENVLETGIRLHHTYGLPFLPGSALKGLAAHYCDTVWGERDEPVPKDEALRFRAARREDEHRDQNARSSCNYHELLFGTTDDSGSIIFHDAWLTPDSSDPLKLDVMTPHHLDWLNGSAPPTDFDSPTPVPFLSVSGSFRVVVSWHGPEDYAKSVAWTNLAFELLLSALADWGIGGKTTSGYGRMQEPEPGKRKKAFSAAALGLPIVGEKIEVTLLAAPKKDKPWRAKVPLRSGKELSGPIEGIPSASPQPGKSVAVIVTEVSEQSIKFEWPKVAQK